MPDETDPKHGSTPGPHPGSGNEPSPAADDENPSGGRKRLTNAVRHPKRSQLVVGVLLAALGFAAVTQVQTTEEDDTYAGARQQELIDVLNALTVTSQKQEEQLEELENTRDELREDSTSNQAALEQARSQVETLNILAGRVPVTGPGIRITITEQGDQIDVDDFIDLIQELRSIGAEAIEINDEVRLVAQSSFEQAAGGLLVDGTLVEPPYVVEAIGEPSTLSGAVTFARGPQDAFESDGAEVTVTEQQEIDIESVRDQG